jgi:hypothetical protein
MTLQSVDHSTGHQYRHIRHRRRASTLPLFSGLVLLLVAAARPSAAAATAAAAAPTIHAPQQPPLPNQRYLQVATVWEGPSHAAAASAATTVVDEVAASLCHVPRRQASLRGAFAHPPASTSPSASASSSFIVAYCAPDLADGDESTITRSSKAASSSSVEQLRQRCANAFYREQLAREVASRTASGLRLVRVACRVCDTASMGKQGTGCL